MNKIKAIFANIKTKLGKKAMTAVTAVTTIGAFAVSACAEGATPITGVDGLVPQVTGILGIVTVIFNYIFTNWYLTIFFCAAIILLGIKLFKSIAKAAKAK